MRSSVFSSGLVRDALAVARALSNVEIAPFPKPARIPRVLQGMRLSHVTPKDLLDDARLLLESIKRKKIIASSGAVYVGAESRIVAGTSGIWHEDEDIQWGAWASAVSGSKKSAYSDSRTSFARFDIQEFGNAIAQKTVEFEHLTPLSRIPNFRSLPIIFTPATVSQLLENAFLDNLNAEQVDKHKSIFADSRGKRELGRITLLDDGRKIPGVNTYGCDEEGSPSRTTTLVRDGTIVNFITDGLHAQKLGIDNTSNGTLSGPDFTNVVLKSFGTIPQRAIIVDNVIGAHTSNSLTTDFSVKVENGFARVGGKVIPLKPFMASGTMLAILSGASAVGKDIEEHDGVYSGSIASKCSLIP
jgi:PmbA protein